MGTKGTRATQALRTTGVIHRIHEYALGDGAGDRRRDPRPGYGLEAAAALGVDPARVLKTLVVDVDGRLASAVVPVAAVLDLKLVASALGGRRASMAEPGVAERATGYVVGGISPFGQRRPLRTVVDVSARSWPTVYVSGGRRGLQVEIAPETLVHLTAALVAPIARDRPA